MLLSIGWLWPAGAGAQNGSQEAYLLVKSNAAETWVYLDSTRLGASGTALWPIRPGQHEVQAGPAGMYAWSFEYETTAINAAPGDTVEVSFHFPYAYSVSSSPSGASVYHLDGSNRQKLGVTPLTYTSDQPLDGTLVIDKVDFDSVHVVPGADIWNSHRIELVGKERSVAEKHVGLPTRREERTWVSYMGAGLAVSAGAAAVYFQRRANRLQASDNPHERLRSDKFEQLSNGSLVAMQLGVGVLAVQLVWR